jgi:CBS domain-containing protein
MQRRIVPDIVENQDIRTLAPGDSVRTAVDLMAERHIGAVLIEDGGKLAGIFTERDLLTRVVAKGKDADATKLSDVMTPNPDCLTPGDMASDALSRMTSKGYRHLPVLDGEKLVGIVSIRDLYAAVKQELEEDVQQREAYIHGGGYGTG